ncbi:MAG: Eco57I restriction-modification methylase domain-containing protein [Sedimentisphaerales bacterium]|nr:Eco57I restriction-modification methylase domain-containing protein [Sedimentisphaerales bacterium]
MATEIIKQLEHVRRKISKKHQRQERSRIGQFLTPAPIAHFMADLFQRDIEDVRILDAGAGGGILSAAAVEILTSRKGRLQSIEVTAYESDKQVLPYLEDALARCEALCDESGIKFHSNIRGKDFITDGVFLSEEGLFSGDGDRYTHAILNPPYKKINSQCKMRRLLDSAGIEVSNLYAAFVWLAARMLESGGEMVAITPRSFCNGPYFRRFRLDLLKMMALQRIHVFESRKKAFREDNVLQENVIFHAIRTKHTPLYLTISSSEDDDFHKMNIRRMPYQRVILPHDRDAFIHLVLTDDDKDVMRRMQRFGLPLDELGIEVSTGRVVDFRAREHLRSQPEVGTVPLIYPCHFEHGFIRWPIVSNKKPNAIVSSSQTRDLMVPKGYYVLTRRFSAKEERRRVVAAVYDPKRINVPLIGFENHLNYFHARGKGLSSNIARGLALYLNSTLFDQYFRLFSGHTQVNATDLRKMRYPTREQLIQLGTYVNKHMPDQEIVDVILQKVCANDG